LSINIINGKDFNGLPVRFLRVENIFNPINKNVAIYNELYRIYHSLYSNLKDSFFKTSKFVKKYCSN
ncbi:MAG: hypothetical protein KJ770_03520, partial [Actinobacteria bacterium]|nr:hypothetical protein [Actinomycetota bacterium]